MLNKVSSLARAVGIILAVVAGFVTLGTMNTGLVILVLGLISGLNYSSDDHVRLGVMTLALPAVGMALGTVPSVGTQLGAVAGNLALAVAGALASSFAMRLFDLVKGDLMGLTAK
jgi:hypothetical protein